MWQAHSNVYHMNLSKKLRTAFKVSIKYVLFFILLSSSRNCVCSEEKKKIESPEKCQHNYNHMQQISVAKYLWESLSDMEDYLSTTEYVFLI